VPRRFALRFALIAFGLYHLPLFLNNVPSFGGGGFRETGLAIDWGHVFGHVGVWVARTVFGVEGEIPGAFSGDNGDSIEEYCRLLVAVVLALAGAAAWVVADRKRPRGEWVGEWLRILLRYSIALGLASYAVAKLWPVQFPALEAPSYEQRLGEASGFGILWATMMYSRAYALFGGIAELVVVLLLVFRRTALLGALICLPVMVNVMLMNWCYGVPVKLYSTMIVLSAAVLVVLDGRRLLDVLVLHRATAAVPIAPPFRSPRWNQYRWAIKALVVGGVLASSVYEMRRFTVEREASAPALAGTWEGEPPWRRVAIGRSGATITLDGVQALRCRATFDDPARSVTLACRDHKATLHWTRDGDTLHLDGTLDDKPFQETLHRRDDSKLPINARFQWFM
jgi:hypothetical protein